MSKAAKSAELIMKLYDLRREATMREARKWFVSFMPESIDDVMRVMVDPKTSGFFRMVATYWDMAASFVNRGAIDEEMFLDSNGEGVIVFAKLQPFINELREKMGSPKYLLHLETLIMRQPNAPETLASRREMMKKWMAARSEMTKASYSK
jgi:hypothetical protein